MQKSYVINGKFMTDRMQGIVRHGRELVKALDELLDDMMDITLLLLPFQKIRTEILRQPHGQTLGAVFPALRAG